ncbi:MAG TPA: hypothetical protein VK656_00615 [Candidatus Acidoferrum sp.]|nr:hypothetical protein [Candidatus Acidoferrum sp.]
MLTRTLPRPLQVVLLVIALMLAAAVGSAWASAAATTPLAGSAAGATAGAPIAATANGVDDATLGAVLAAAIDGPATDGGTMAAAPSARPLARAARGAGILRTIVGRTDRAEITVTTASGERTILFVRGTIAALTATGITVTMRDGTSQSYVVDATTRFRAQGKQIAPADLKTGETALVLGLKTGDTYTARFVRGLPLARTPTGS